MYDSWIHTHKTTCNKRDIIQITHFNLFQSELIGVNCYQRAAHDNYTLNK